MQETNKNTLIQSKGIPFQRLINKENYTNFLDIIQCKICFNILKNPYDCSSCGNSFCYNCISNLLKSHKKCPFNCQNVTIKPSSYGIISYLSKLNFYCKNKDYGCNEIISYQNLDIHEKECKYFYTICPNGQCNKKLLWDSLENHLKNECFYTLIKCQYCNQDFNRIEYNEHLKNCKSFQNYLSFSINKNTNDDIKKHQKNFENLLNSLPVIKDASFLTLMKMILYQFNLNNQILYNKIGELKSDIKSINQNNIIIIEQMTKEIKLLNQTINNLLNKDNFYFQNIASPISKAKYSDNDSILSTNEAQNFLNDPVVLNSERQISENLNAKDNNINKNIDNGKKKNNEIENTHKKYESSKLSDNKFSHFIFKEDNEDDKEKIISLKKIESMKINEINGKIKPYLKKLVNYPRYRRLRSKNLYLIDKINYMINIINENTNKIIKDINNNQKNSLNIILGNIKTLENKMEKEIVYSQQIPYNYNTNINKIKNEKN